MACRSRQLPGVFWQRLEAFATHFKTLNYEATLLAAATVAILIVCRAISNRIPGPIVALVIGTAAVYLFKLPVETIGTRFGGIPERVAASSDSPLPRGPDSRIAETSGHSGHAGRD